MSHGIQNEGSDLRAHVCVLAKTVYIFPTICGQAAISSGKYKGKPATQPGHRHKPTAWGFPVPVNDIERVVSVRVAHSIDQFNFREDDSTSIKGDKATKLVAYMLRKGIFSLPVDPEIILDSDLQIKGTDINVRAKFRIQIKCDYRGGIGPGCTGNLYLQTDEINPFKNV